MAKVKTNLTIERQDFNDMHDLVKRSNATSYSQWLRLIIRSLKKHPGSYSTDDVIIRQAEKDN